MQLLSKSICQNILNDFAAMTVFPFLLSLLCIYGKVHRQYLMYPQLNQVNWAFHSYNTKYIILHIYYLSLIFLYLEKSVGFIVSRRLK